MNSPVQTTRLPAQQAMPWDPALAARCPAAWAQQQLRQHAAAAGELRLAMPRPAEHTDDTDVAVKQG